MNVYGTCRNCKDEIAYRTNASTRLEFSILEGETKRLHCKTCGTNTELDIDALYAKPSKTAYLVAGIILVIGMPTILFFVDPLITGNLKHYVIYAIGGFLLVPIIAFIILKAQDKTRVSEFNNRKLKG